VLEHLRVADPAQAELGRQSDERVLERSSGEAIFLTAERVGDPMHSQHFVAALP
jgi:hypothetical protein